MPVAVKAVMRMLCSIAEEKKMKVAVEPSNKRVPFAVMGAMIGGLVGGPPGFAVGGFLAGLLGGQMTGEPFKPVCKILQELSHALEQKLFTRVKAVIWNLDWMDNVELLGLVMNSERLRQQLADVLVDFFKAELKTDVLIGSSLSGQGASQE